MACNLLHHPFAGLLFLIPGWSECFRANDRIQISVDLALCARFTQNGVSAKSVLVIRVDEAFIHCGRAVAFMMDDALLAGERAKSRKPDQWDIVGTPQSKEAYGCMLRKDDAPFKTLMDDTIAHIQTSGEAAKWYDK